jgi:hypothetical protein
MQSQQRQIAHYTVSQVFKGNRRAQNSLLLITILLSTATVTGFTGYTYEYSTPLKALKTLVYALLSLALSV